MNYISWLNQVLNISYIWLCDMFSITEIINVDEKSDPQNKDRNTINGYILVYFFAYIYIYL